jgi:hypothetical protein
MAKDKITNWHVGIQEDAEWMSRTVFIRKHGIYAAAYFDQFQRDMDQHEYEYLEMDDGA